MRLLVALLVLPLLAGCLGYQPLYEQGVAGNTAQVQLGLVQMQEIEEGVGARRAAQQVAQDLVQVFPYTGGDYTLQVTIRERVSSLAVRRDATDQRLELSLRAIVRLEDQMGEAVFNFNTTTAAAYNVGTSPYATEAGRVRAKRTASEALSEEIALRVRRFLATVESSTE